ncbi:MAG: sugar phosphate isomerase/epimerase [Planctomycetes bacterium]|nr:sugar phosphate isomerase/epimerase [Planctomycetota bacterium]MBL7145438.1 sugar phosphate isomerase/epimerase [Phycisphaerae bacterium]
MIKSCATIALVPEIKTGPWIYWDGPDISIPKAAKLSFDAVELFTASADAVDPEQLEQLCDANKIKIAAVGTGAGKVLHGLTLTNPDKHIRQKAVAFISEMVTFGARFGAPAIIGSMQGNVESGIERKQAVAWLAEGLNELGRRAQEQGVRLIYEPLNRYETNMFNQLGMAADFLETLDSGNVVLLADLFHMNIEEESIAGAIRENARHIGHLHFADSNRRPVGMGHTDMKDIARALTDIGYTGYASAEALPWPDPDAAAEQTMRAFKECFSVA